MKQVLAACAILALLAAPAAAQENYVSTEAAKEVARTMGEIVGSETGCALAIDANAVSFHITNLIPPNNTEFARDLELRSQLTGIQFDRMSATAKAAWCTQMRRLGQEYHLIK